MTLARQVFPGTFLITRRCAQRQFLLTPSDEMNAAFLFCLLHAAAKFDVELHGYVFMSDHYHIVCSTKGKTLPSFCQWLNLHLAKLVNAQYGRWDNVWDTRKYSAVHLADPKAVLDALAYVGVNPVAAFLVRTPAEWPGLRTLPTQLGETLRASRPAFFFRQRAKDAPADPGSVLGRIRRAPRRAPLPEEAELELTVPPMLSDLAPDAVGRALAELIATRVAAIHADPRARRRGFLGPARILRQSHRATPRSPSPRRRHHRIACSDDALRQQLLDAQARFWADYELARDAFRTGDRDVLFPANTYGPAVLYGARVAAT
jgi:putative transposase